MARCSFCEHENPPTAARCAKCSAWLVQSADVAPHVADSAPAAEVAREPQHVDPGSTSTFGMSAADFSSVLAALAAGDKIDAIKQLRHATGLGLADAKQAAEALERMGSLLGDPTGPQVEISQDRGVTKIVRRQVLVGSGELSPEMRQMLQQIGARRAPSSGCVTRVGAVLLALLGSLACGLALLGR